jgi:23S rRNA (uracil1939-C5)-methyltransferase
MSVPAVDVVDVEITGIAAGGDGVGRAGGLVVFLPRTAPGDRVRARVRITKRFARGAIETMLAASPERVDPPCAHYRDDRCGGCQLQHLGYESQLRAKSGIVHDSIARIGKRPISAPIVRPSPREWRYRAKLTLAMRADKHGWTMGLHPYDDPSAVFQLVDCPITDERVVSTWREIMSAAHLLPRVPELRGFVRLLGGEARAIVIEGGTEWATATEFFARIPSAGALWWRSEGGARRLVAQRSDAPAGASFGQVNPEVAAALRAYVVARVLAYAPRTVVDAYAGTGDTAVAIGEQGARVTAIELDRDAAAKAASRLPAGSRALSGRVEDLLVRALPADVVLVNPPRAGLDARVTSILQRHTRSTRAIIYVSCDPATLARDLARLPDFGIASVVAFDMFPQTAHVETVCTLVPHEVVA